MFEVFKLERVIASLWLPIEMEFSLKEKKHTTTLHEILIAYYLFTEAPSLYFFASLYQLTALWEMACLPCAPKFAVGNFSDTRQTTLLVSRRRQVVEKA